MARHGAIQRAEDDHGHIFGRRLAAENLADREAIHQIFSNLIENTLNSRNNLAAAYRAAGRTHDFKALAGQVKLHQVQEVGLVIDNQHSRLHGQHGGPRR